MPFLAPAIPALAGAGASAGLGKLLAGGPSSLEKQALAQQLAAGEKGLATGTSLLNRGLPALDQPINYWTTLLSGNRAGLTSMLAPELLQYAQGQRQAGLTSANLMSRGGPSATFFAELPFQQQRDVSTMFQQARTGAAAPLASAGSNLLSMGIDAIYGTTPSGQALLGYERDRRTRDQATGSAIGNTVFDIIEQLNLGGKGGGGGSTSTPKAGSTGSRASVKPSSLWPVNPRSGHQPVTSFGG